MVGLWKQIQDILKETARPFPGMRLTYFYLCPSCLLELCGNSELKNLPEKVLVDKFACHTEDKEIYLCKKGHSLHRTSITHGISFGREMLSKRLGTIKSLIA